MNRLAILIAPIVTLLAAQSAQVPEYQNAGVLPYSTSSGEVRILLGLDSERDSWSDFVGVCTPGETPAATAAREFGEETRGVFPAEQAQRRLEGIEPVELGPTRIFLLEVPETPVLQISRMSRGRYTEKTDYCWVSLDALLQSVDANGAGRAAVPPSCGGDTQELFDLTAANLVQGQELRRLLTVAYRDGEPAASGDVAAPRCGR